MWRRASYLLLTVGLFAVEVLIATRLRHLEFVRGSLGDVLVVILLYSGALSLREWPRAGLAVAVFLFACAIEVGQHFHFARALGFGPGSIGLIVLGDTFQWSDLLCYLTGAILAYAADTWVLGYVRLTAPAPAARGPERNGGPTGTD